MAGTQQVNENNSNKSLREELESKITRMPELAKVYATVQVH